MTTPANPTPEPSSLEAARAKVPNHLQAQVADLTQQLSDTRRRLAEVEKERDDAYDRGRSHELTEGNWLEVAKDRDEARNALERICVALRNPPIQADLPRVVHEIVKQRDDATVQLTALRNAADGMAKDLQEYRDAEPIRVEREFAQRDRLKEAMRVSGELSVALKGCSQRLQCTLAEMAGNPQPVFETPAPSPLDNIKAIATALAAYAALTEGAGKETSL